MTPQVGLLLGILAVAVALFVFEWISADVIALGVLLTLVLTGLLPAQRAFAGFGSDTVILILGLLILTAALFRTGVVELAGRTLVRRAGNDPRRLQILVMLGAVLLSSFISNTAAAAFFLPITMAAAARLRTSPSMLLMPMAFASILASSVTLVATSTNIVVSGLITQYQLAPLGMFELTPVGVPIAVAGIAYLVFVGRRLIPDRTPPGEMAGEFGLGPYLTEALVLPNSPLVGTTLAEAGLGRDLDLTVLSVIRSSGQHLTPRSATRLEANDLLLLEGRRDDILKIKDARGIEIKADVTLSDPDLVTEDVRLAEVILMPGSPVIGRTLKSVGFRQRYGLQVLAVNRQGQTMRQKLSAIRLRMGDVLFVQGHHDRLAALADSDGLRMLGAVTRQRPNLGRAPIALGIFVAALGAGASGLLALPVAVMLGAVLAFLSRCLTPEEAYREVEWRVIILIGSMLAVGAAMQTTGTAAYLAGTIAGIAGRTGPVVLLSGFFALTVLLTQPMSNQAAAAVVVPVAVQTAIHLGYDPRAFAVMIAVAASTSYLTPLEPACLMTYGPGRYRFADFVKVGGLLTLVVYVIAILLVPRFWPLAP